MNTQPFANILLQWYAYSKRDLPWRNTKDPYIIWLSEIILQQTRVAQGLPYFERFLERFPTVEDLASAPIEEIMRLWQGLGYYSRARNLHACAQEVSMNRNGRFPDNYNHLLQLKGVGSYTAAAIASFAFGEKIAVLDGNVFRVLARYFGIAADIGSTHGKKAFEKLANQIIPESQPDEYNQAIMEFGALQCVPKNPACGDCPLNKGCFAYGQGLVKRLPVNEKKVRINHRTFLYFHINCGNEVLVKERGGNDIWQGLVDFPMEELPKEKDINLNFSPLFAELQAFEPDIQFDPEKNYKHILTHQKIFSNFVKLDISAEQKQEVGNWAKGKGYFSVNEDELEQLGKPKLIVNYLADQK
ncbi:MAG TPA: A/G-specific adenine glycosylase [Cyclobacteriaceae bacterium]|nr:A/G-specific adenine glycosylase [Cyclobacteriaceae bacterium]